jgi:hypothetical protein
MFESLLGGGAGGGTSINPDMSQHASSSGQFGDHNIGLGAGKNATLILAGAAVLIALIFFWKR